MKPAKVTPTCGLTAIILITRSRPGPKLVFNYPAAPSITHYQKQADSGAKDDSDLDSDTDEGQIPAERPVVSDRLADDLDPSEGFHRRAVGERRASLAQDDASRDRALGYSAESLEKLLSPGRWSDRKKFEVCLDGVTFIGHPVYANEDGEWSSKKHDDDLPASQSSNGHSRAGSSEQKQQRMLAERTANITITSPDTPAKVEYDYTHVPESLDSQNGALLATSFESASTASGVPLEQLTMFHVVFVLSGNEQSDASRVHNHVAKKLSKALHYCQRQSKYVAQESRRLLALKARARQIGGSMETLWADMVESSELAWALKEIYEKISRGQVAGIRLSGIEMSLQVPQEDAVDDTAVPPDGQCGLLLLEDKDVLLRELSHPEASPLTYFIQEHTPTKNLQKHASNLSIPLTDILYLAEHLVKWRKARYIAPLHPRNTYVVQPDAPIDRVAELVPIYARQFAALPTLPQLLKVLSGRPIKYGVLIPSRDHKAPYMDILAFLHRHSFVAQLKTFGWLRARRGRDPVAVEQPHRQTTRPVSGVSLLSPHLRPVDDDNISVASGQTAVTAIPAGHDGVHVEPLPECTIIHCPQDQDEETAKALRQIKGAISDMELRDRLPQLLPYFDGEHALEEIAGKEGMKRSKIEDWLEELERQGLLLIFRAL